MNGAATEEWLLNIFRRHTPSLSASQGVGGESTSEEAAPSTQVVAVTSALSLRATAAPITPNYTSSSPAGLVTTRRLTSVIIRAPRVVVRKIDERE